jgi:hypothetical protein
MIVSVALMIFGASSGVNVSFKLGYNLRDGRLRVNTVPARLEHQPPEHPDSLFHCLNAWQLFFVILAHFPEASLK